MTVNNPAIANIGPYWGDPPGSISHGQAMHPGEEIVGTCSLCRGPVCVPRLWGGIIPPTPVCRGCGATKKAAHGPVIEMERK